MKSVLSCLPGNTSKLSQRLRISCIDGRCAVTPVVVRSSCLRVNDWFSLLFSPLFCFRDKKGEKEDHFPTRGESSATFCHTENKLLLRLSTLIKTTLFLRLISKTYVDFVVTYTHIQSRHVLGYFFTLGTLKTKSHLFAYFLTTFLPLLP